MKLYSGILGVVLTAQICTASKALLCLSDHASDQASLRQTAISLSVARLLIAQRLDLSQYQDLGDADEETLDVLNTYGARSPSLFSQGQNVKPKRKQLLVLEGVQHPDEVINGLLAPTLPIDNSPSSSATQKFASELESQAHQDDQSTVIYDTSLQDLPRTTGAKYESTLSSIRSQIQTSLSSGIELTLLITPPSSRKSLFFSKSKDSSAWGTSHKKHVKRQQPEEILSPASANSTSSSDPSTSGTSPTATHALPKGPLSMCWPTEDELNTATNSCSGRGTARQRSRDCFVCKCHATAVENTNGKGKKTIKWGGAACQKKDVSMPFFLIGGLTVGLVVTVAWGVSLLVAVGDQELPGVLGAGVVGPRAQK